MASCYPQRTEFLYSARNGREYGEIAEMFADLYSDVSVNAGRWIGAVRHHMAQAGEYRRDLLPVTTDRASAMPVSSGPGAPGAPWPGGCLPGTAAGGNMAPLQPGPSTSLASSGS
ncbi:hypothetical protein [Streptomyces albus]|uniref:hypothetical protein n=1 Tax=Streptomyces albus TaxID=1888 RepID=UPI000AB543E5|nr:hypothetical protein [Streptomyces albus]